MSSNYENYPRCTRTELMLSYDNAIRKSGSTARMKDPETLTPTVAMRVPEMRNETTHWQIGTASLTRVKINALRPDVKIRTEDSGRIRGMYSEAYAAVETLGTAIIHICERPMRVHVTRSKCTAPIVADGILGYDFLKPYWRDSTRELMLPGLPKSIPISTGNELIVNYSSLLRRRLIEASISRERGPWSVVPKRLAKLRNFFPPSLANDERRFVLEILEDYADCFYLNDEKLEFTSLMRYRIKTRNDNIISLPANNLSHEDLQEIDRQVENLLRQSIIRVSTSAYDSPIRLIKKKPDSRGNANNRLAIDYHELNKISESDKFPIPDIIELVDRLDGTKYYSVFDLASASYQIKLDGKDREKTAFTTRNGHYEFQRMPLGIKNASQNIQRLLNIVIDDMLYSPCMAFVCYDDIIVYSSCLLVEHEIRVRKLLSRIQDAGLKLQPSKCQMFETSVSYLGYLVTDMGLRPEPPKIRKILDHELPITRHFLSIYLGLTSSFKRFIPNYAEIAKPMANLLKNNDEKFVWTSEGKKSFDEVKKAFSGELLLQYPDWNERFILETSSSAVAIQAALLQKKKSHDDRDLPVAYASRCCTPEETKYSEYNRECLAAMYGMDTWYWYLGDPNEKKFVLRTRKPRAFDWYVKRETHGSDVLRRFEISFSGKYFTIEALDTME